MSKTAEIIKYANCWEDADLLLSTVPANPGRIFSIGSGGDNSFALLTKNTPEIIVVDYNSVQLYLIELKAAAIRQLQWEEYLRFAGFRDATDRTGTYRLIRNSLTANAKNYWDKHTREIEEGIIHCGKFERYFKLFRKYILPLTHKKNTVERLFTVESAASRHEFYHKYWNNWRWKMLSALFFSRFMQARLGRSPEFLNHAGNNMGELLRNNIQRHLVSPESAENFFLEYIVNGNFSRKLPFYARKENYYTIKERLQNMRLVPDEAKNVVGSEKGIGFYNLSNIFEYMDAATFRTFVVALVKPAMKDTLFAYWNLFADRRLNSIVPGEIMELDYTAGYSGPDKGFFYSKFFIDKRC